LVRFGHEDLVFGYEFWPVPLLDRSNWAQTDGKLATTAAAAAASVNELMDGLLPEAEESILKRCIEQSPAAIASFLDEEKIPPLEGEVRKQQQHLKLD